MQSMDPTDGALYLGFAILSMCCYFGFLVIFNSIFTVSGAIVVGTETTASFISIIIQSIFSFIIYVISGVCNILYYILHFICVEILQPWLPHTIIPILVILGTYIYIWFDPKSQIPSKLYAVFMFIWCPVIISLNESLQSIQWPEYLTISNILYYIMVVPIIYITAPLLWSILRRIERSYINNQAQNQNHNQQAGPENRHKMHNGAGILKHVWKWRPSNNSSGWTPYSSGINSDIEGLRVGQEYYLELANNCRVIKYSLDTGVETDGYRYGQHKFVKRFQYLILWEWEERNGEWTAYDDEVSYIIEALEIGYYHQFRCGMNVRKLVITRTSENEAVELNQFSNERRRVRRTQTLLQAM